MVCHAASLRLNREVYDYLVALTEMAHSIFLRFAYFYKSFVYNVHAFLTFRGRFSHL
jgi:hypothetical protein